MSIVLDVASEYAKASGNPIHRANACVALGLMNDLDSLAMLRTLSADPDPGVRNAAGKALRQRISAMRQESLADRLEVARSLRRVAASELSSFSRATVFWPQYLIVILLPLLIWLSTTILLAPWPALNLGSLDLTRWGLSVGLGVAGVLIASLSVCPLPRDMTMADLLLELQGTLVPALLLGVTTTAGAYVVVEDDLGIVSIGLILMGTALYLAVLRLETALIRWLVPTAPVATVVGLAVTACTGTWYLAVLGAVSGAGAGSAGFVVLGLPPTIAIAMTYLRADFLLPEGLPTRRQDWFSVRSGTVVAGLTIIAMPGFMFLLFLLQGRAAALAETVLPGQTAPPAQQRLLALEQDIPLTLSRPSTVQLVTEGVLLRFTISPKGVALPELSSPGRQLWLPAGEYAWRVVPEESQLQEAGTELNTDVSFEQVMDALRFLFLRSNQFTRFGLPAENPPSSMRLALVTFNINPGEEEDDWSRIASFESQHRKGAGEKLGIVPSSADGPVLPGSVFTVEANAAGSPVSVRSEARSGDESAKKIPLLPVGPGAAMTLLDRYQRVFQPFQVRPALTAFSLALQQSNTALFEQLLALEPPGGRKGETVVYLGGTRFAPVGIGAQLRVATDATDSNLPYASDALFLEFVSGQISNISRPAPGRTAYVLLPKNQLGSLDGADPTIVDGIRALNGRPTWGLTPTNLAATATTASGLADPAAVASAAAIAEAGAHAGEWMDSANIPVRAPPEFDGYFVVVAQNYFDVGTVVTGTDWDQSENPGFSRVVDGIADSSDWDYVYTTQLTYLGEKYDPAWEAMFQAVPEDIALGPLPNSPDVLQQRFAGGEAGVSESGYYIEVGGNTTNDGSIYHVEVQEDGNVPTLAFGWTNGQYPISLLYLGAEYDSHWEDVALSIRQTSGAPMDYIDMPSGAWHRRTSRRS